jgi:hypothetical protein
MYRHAFGEGTGPAFAPPLIGETGKLLPGVGCFRTNRDLVNRSIDGFHTSIISNRVKV